MVDEFEQFDPHQFFEVFVLRACEEHFRSPLDRYHLKMAIHNANVLAERVWHHSRGNINSLKFENAARYREYLAVNECSDFQLVWDIDDGHKHAEIGRKSRLVTSSAQTGVLHGGGAIGSMAVGEDAIGGTSDDFVVKLDSGVERSLTEVLQNVLGMWRRILS